MRIIRGIYKTRKFKFPKGFPSRPTTDFAKEGLFNILENQIDLIDLNILDLCAGTGNISVEFLSRESGFITSVDSNFNCVRHMKQVAKDLGCDDKMDVIKADAIKFLENTPSTYDIIFADPPYIFKDHHKIAEIVFERKLLKENGILIIEHGRDTEMEDITQFDFSRRYGNVVFSFFN